jgi:hypothetical protein
MRVTRTSRLLCLQVVYPVQPELGTPAEIAVTATALDAESRFSVVEIDSP